MNILGLISQLIGIETLRLTMFTQVHKHKEQDCIEPNGGQTQN